MLCIGPDGRFLSLFLSLPCIIVMSAIDLAGCNVDSMESTAMHDPFQVAIVIRSHLSMSCLIIDEAVRNSKIIWAH
ncbi:hypothetical protein H4582DRAFT_1955612, partial [Lactarius indigo]